MRKLCNNCTSIIVHPCSSLPFVANAKGSDGNDDLCGNSSANDKLPNTGDTISPPWTYILLPALPMPKAPKNDGDAFCDDHLFNINQ